MPTFVEQRLRTCESCQRPFAVQYRFGGLRPESPERDRVFSRWLACPALGCGRRNAILLPYCALDVVAKTIPGTERPTAPARQATLRRLWALLPMLPKAPRLSLHRRSFLTWLDLDA